MVAAQAAGPSRPPATIEDFLWNIHTVLIQNGGPVQLDNLKDLYSKQLGHKCSIERFLVVGDGGLAATLKRIPHIVSLDASALSVKAALGAGTTKEELIAADQAYRKELQRKSNAAKAKAKAPAAPDAKAKAPAVAAAPAKAAAAAPAAEPKATAPQPQAEKRPADGVQGGGEQKKARTEADAETLSRMLVQGVVRVLQNRGKAGQGPLPIGELEDEFKKLWKVPFNLAQAGESDTAAFLQKWPNKVEVVTEGGVTTVQLAKKGAAGEKAVPAAKKASEPTAAKSGTPVGSPPPKEPPAVKASAPATAAKAAAEEPKAAAAPVTASAPAAAAKNGPTAPKRPAAQPTRPPMTIEDFLWNIHQVIEAYGTNVPLDQLKEAYSKHLGHKCCIERFLVVGEGGLAATLKRIPHVVTICQEGTEVTLKATQPLGTNKEQLIQADQAYRRQLQQKSLAATAKTAPAGKTAAAEPKAPAPAVVAKTPAAAAPAAAAVPAKAGADGEREAKKARTEDVETLGKMLAQGIVRVLQNRVKEGKGLLPVSDIEEEFKALWKVPFNLSQANETDIVSFLEKWPNKVEVKTNSDGVQVVQLVKKATEKAKAPTATKASAAAPAAAQPAASPRSEAPAQPPAQSKATAGDAAAGTAPSSGAAASPSTASGASAAAGPTPAVPAAAPAAAPATSAAPAAAPAAPAPAGAAVATAAADDSRSLPEIRKEATSILQAMQEAVRRQEALVASLEKLG